MDTVTTKPDLSTAVADSQRMREEAKNRPYTIADAVKDARWVRSTPDGLMAPEAQRRLVDTLLSALELHPAYLKAVERGQGVFPLVQQDRCAPAGIAAWAVDAAEHGVAPAKVAEALRLAVRWKDQSILDTKFPD